VSATTAEALTPSYFTSLLAATDTLVDLTKPGMVFELDLARGDRAPDGPLLSGQHLVALVVSHVLHPSQTLRAELPFVKADVHGALCATPRDLR
jgi:hypothetical protein